MSRKIKKNEFKCSSCGNIYKKGWSDKEAMEECADIWGDVPAEEQAIVCDDCFKKVPDLEIREMGKEYKNNKKLTE
jgi:DNA-directed RNA polymerase subunit RPC12/RpoP